MLIEFSVENYRSFRDRQTLSLVASTRDKEHPENLIDPEIPGLKNTQLVKSAAIYGANASGKTNLYAAAEFMRDFVVDSATKLKPGEGIDVAPFKLDPAKISSPTEFEALFVYQGIRYQYGFVLDNRLVHEEWLTAYPEGRPQRWFHREFEPDGSIYKWKFSDKHFRVDKDSLKQKTRSNNLFLSVGAQFNNEQLTLVYEWFRSQFRFVDPSLPLWMPDITASMMMDDKEIQDRIPILLQQADLGITDVHVRRIKPDEPKLPNDLTDGEKKIIMDRARNGSLVTYSFRHYSQTNPEGVPLSDDDESAGTLKFFSMLGPWLQSLNQGYVLFVDEIGASMHPLLVSKLVEMFNSSATNKSGAQLIFTTHDTTLLDSSLLRRDQAWFTEKDQAGASVLYPLTDYKPRKEEALQKGYLAGRYGAIPFLGDFTF